MRHPSTDEPRAHAKLDPLVVDDHGLGDEEDETDHEESDHGQDDHGRDATAPGAPPRGHAMMRPRIRIIAHPICVCRYAMFEA